jgi:hypothetical protein
VYSILVQYIGFESKTLVREYTFSVRAEDSEFRQYTLTIAHEAFASRRARYQDAPDICLLKLRRELATAENHPAATHFSVSDMELADYHDSRKEKPARRFQPRREE